MGKQHRHYKEEDEQMVNKHLKTCLISLLVGKCKLKL